MLPCHAGEIETLAAMIAGARPARPALQREVRVRSAKYGAV
jgi:hypothetical protein